MILKFHLLKKLDTNPLSFKRADVRMMSNYIVNNSKSMASRRYVDMIAWGARTHST